MNALLEQFLLESRDLIAEGTRGLIALERTPDDGALVVGVFRVFHTLKGSSGVFGIQPMTRMLHAAEDMLAAIRDGRTPIGPALIDTLLECLDQTARWLDELEVRDGLSGDADGNAAGLIRRLRGDDAAATVSPDAPDFVDPGIFSEAERSAAVETLRGQAEGAALYVLCREQAGREASPTAAIIDSQSVKSAEKGGPASTCRATTRVRRSRARSGTSWSTPKAC